MQILWLILGAAGLYFIASALTEQGLLPSGHGAGRWGEGLMGLGLVLYAAFRFWSSRRRT